MAEKRLEYQFELEDVWSPDTSIHDANPLGKVPCLIMEDGGALFDSRVIVEYLDTLTPVAKLIPPNGRERAEVRTWEALADGVMDAAILVRLEQTQRPAEQQSRTVDRSADEQGARRYRIDGSRLWRKSRGATATRIRWPISRSDARWGIWTFASRTSIGAARIRIWRGITKKSRRGRRSSIRSRRRSGL